MTIRYPLLRLACSVLLSISALSISGCCRQLHSVPSATVESTASLLAEGRAGRGVVIIVHGLNQRPSSLDPLADQLRAMGHHTYRIVLSGHDREQGGLFDESLWEDDIVRAYAAVRERHRSTPIYLLGYSLGGLLVTRALDTHPEIKPAGVVLIAPALSLRLLPQTGYLLTLLPPVSWSIPNVAPEGYRRFAYTPLFWYRNTFSLYDATRKVQSQARLAAIPTTIIANPRDELVSLSGLQTWIKENQLDSQWTIEVVSPEPLDPAIPEHVITDERSLGSLEWSRMLGIIRNSVAARPIPH